MSEQLLESRPNDALEFIFLGTGPSSSVPEIGCLTSSLAGRKQKCNTCTSALLPEGQNNIRRNTGAAFRVTGKDGDDVTVVIDVGKNFQASALEWFPKYGLRKIDAVLITHGHCDALNGLDDLRAWTINSSIQPHVDIYVSQATMKEIQQTFPFLVQRDRASNGGYVTEIRFHMIEEGVPFEIGNTGVKILPFAVHHGLGPRVEKRQPPGNLPTPPYALDSGFSTPLSTTIALPGEQELQTPKRDPFLCLGFKINNELIYMSDVSCIPEHVWATLIPDETGCEPRAHNVPVFVVDCLRLEGHTTHFGVKDAVKAARRMNATRSYLTDICHDVSHDEFEQIGRGVEDPSSINLASVSENVRRGLELAGEGPSCFVRPAFDGLRLLIGKDGSVRESSDTSRRLMF